MEERPFIVGYEHDIFVSYAHEVTLGEWTVSFGQDLQKALDLLLQSKLKGRSIDVWIDELLRKNQPLGNQLEGCVKSSALLLIAMSPFYLGSAEWCGKELSWFAENSKSKIHSDRRVFLIDLVRTDRTSWPERLKDLTSFPFYWKHPIANLELPVGLIGDKEDQAQYRAAIYTLAGQIRQQIEDIIMDDVAASSQAASLEGKTPETNKLAFGSKVVWLEVAGDHPQAKSISWSIRERFTKHGVDIIASTDFGKPPRDPLSANRQLDKMARAKLDCAGLLFLRLDDSAPVGNWFLDYISEIRPQLLLKNRAASSVMLLDAAQQDAPPPPSSLPVLRTDHQDFLDHLDKWIRQL